MKKDNKIVYENAQRPVDIKEHNSKFILNLIQGMKQISATELASITHLSKATITKIFSNFSEMGLIELTGYGESTKKGGKRPMLYSLASDYFYSIIVLANDPNHLEVFIVNSCAAIVDYEKIEGNKHSTYESFLDSISKSINNLVKLNLPRKKILGVALLYDGIVDSGAGMILDSAFHSWTTGLPVVKDIKERLSFDTFVVIGNATDFSAYAELSNYEMYNKKKMVINLADNGAVGCTLVSEEDLDLNENYLGISGGVAHLIIDSASKVPCKCGMEGCMMSVLSLEALSDAIENKLKMYPNSPVSINYQKGICSYDVVFENAALGDELAEWLMDKVAYYYAILIHNVITLNNIDVVILQGVFVKSGEKFRDLLYKRIKNFNNLHIPINLDIVYSEFSKQERTVVSCVMGAGLFLMNKYINDSGVLR